MLAGIRSWERFLTVWEQTVPAGQLGLLYYLKSPYGWCTNQEKVPTLYQVSAFCLKVVNECLDGYDKMTEQGDWATRYVLVKMLKKSVIIIIDKFEEMNNRCWSCNQEEQFELLKLLNDPRLQYDDVKLIDAEHFNRKIGDFLEKYCGRNKTGGTHELPDEWYWAVMYFNHPKLFHSHHLDSTKQIEILTKYLEDIKKKNGWSLIDCLQMGSYDGSDQFAQILLILAKREHELDTIIGIL